MRRDQAESDRVTARARLLMSDQVARAHQLYFRATVISLAAFACLLLASLYCEPHGFRRWWLSHAAAACAGASCAFVFAKILIEIARKYPSDPTKRGDL